MKTKFFGLALAALTLTSFTGFAQKTASCDSTCQSGKTCSPCKKVKKDGKAVNPFEGLTLTDTQKAQLKDLRAKRAEKVKAAKAGKQRTDSVSRADRQGAQREYLEEVKAIIGPDQYVIFLENQVINDGGRGGKAVVRQAKAKKDGKDSAARPGKKGDRPDKKGNRPDKKDRK